MTKIKQLTVILNKLENLTRKPESYLSADTGRSEEIKTLTKDLYDFTKSIEKCKKSQNALPELVIQGFDEEQIWQELELQNNTIFDGIVADVAHLIAKKDRMAVPVTAEGVESEEEEEEDESDEEHAGQESEDEEDMGSDEEGKVETQNEQLRNEPAQTEVDDQFFKLRDMEQFLEKIEKDVENEEETEESDVDYFAEVSDADSQDSETAIRYRYSDFFDAPGEGKKRAAGAAVAKSSFEGRQERLRARIEDMEAAALEPKPWQLRGEVVGGGRPHNSLLEEYVEFDLAARPAPVMTEQCSLRLEQVIQQRVRDKAWDDVDRKVKPVEGVAEYKQRLVLDQEKSKLSLAEIYEKEYLKQRAAAEGALEETPDAEPAAHAEIKAMTKTLMTKLDALCNFHFTPKMVTPEVKVISNLPAVAMEEVAPVAVSDAALLAPEEVKRKPKGDVKGTGERTKTDKKRARRLKKTKQRMRQKEKEKREKIVEKLNPGLGNKYSKEKAKKMLEKVTKEGNVTRLDAAGKYVRSSKTFFSQLQDEVSGHIKKHTVGKAPKKTPPKFNAKKLKL